MLLEFQRDLFIDLVSLKGESAVHCSTLERANSAVHPQNHSLSMSCRHY